MSRQQPVELSSGGNVVDHSSRMRVPRTIPDSDTLRRLQDACETVLTDDAALADSSRDWWPISIKWAIDGTVPALPAAVAIAGSVEEVADILAVCRDSHIPITTSAGRSGVCGGAVPLFGGVVLDMTAIAGIRDIDAKSLTVRVSAGTFGPPLEEELQRNGFTLGHWPQSFDISTVGGWLACRSAGQYSTRYGKIEDMARSLQVVLADSSIIRTGSTAPRSSTGPDLNHLFMGSEGTLGIITEASLAIHPVPAASCRRAWSFTRFPDGLEACRMILRSGATPAVLRLYDSDESALHFGTDGVSILIVYDEADQGLLDWTCATVDRECAAQGGEAADTDLVSRWFKKRNDVSALAPLYKSGIVVDTIEVAASWANLHNLYVECTDSLRSHRDTIYASAHLSHSYPDGACIYMTFAGQMDGTRDTATVEAYYNASWQQVMAAVMRAGGAISHHHGIGIQRSTYLRDALGPAWKVMEALKEALDPAGILNPGKLGFSSHLAETPWP
ncbi:MAG: FAD-binding oxidoreductase [Acidimicrobiales bacterium]